MNILGPKDSREFQCRAYSGSLELMHELRDKLREWLEKQPHLPQDIPDCRLEFFVIHSKHNLEVAKRRLDMYYTMRKLVPEIFTERDPLAPQIKELSQFVQWVCLPKLTPEGYRVTIARYVNEFFSTSLDVAVYKFAFMVADIRMTECTRSTGDIYLFEFGSMRLGHLLNLNLGIIKKSEVAASSAYGVRIKGIHFINTPSSLSRVFTLVKSLLKPKLAARVYVHPDFESLYKHIPKSVLPVDYGGVELSMDELDSEWHRTLEDWRDWFLEEEKKTVVEELRPGPMINTDELFGVHGSFRKLQID